MSYQPHPTKGPGWWYLVLDKVVTDPVTGIKKRQQKKIAFKGTEAEVAALDVQANQKKVDLEYPTMLELLPSFQTYYRNNSRPNTYLAMQSALKHLLPFFGEMRIPLITSTHIEEYKTKRLQDTYLPGKHGQRPEDDTEDEAQRRRPMGRNSINRELNALKAFFTWAKGEKVAINVSIMLFPKKSINTRKPIPLAPAELGKLLAHLKGTPHETLVRLMLWGGLRRTEACHLRCEDIDLEGGVMYVERKGGQIKSIAILGSLKEHLAAVKDKRTSGYLVTNPKTGKPYGNIMKTLRTAGEKAGISKHLYHHLLRHTSGTIMMNGGVQQRAIQTILDHADISTTSIYTHPSAPFIQEVGAVLDDIIEPNRVKHVQLDKQLKPRKTK